jgi:hypothetical protein
MHGPSHLTPYAYTTHRPTYWGAINHGPLSLSTLQVDLRDDLHSGPEFDHDDSDQMREWVNAILDAMYDARHGGAN